MTHSRQFKISTKGKTVQNETYEIKYKFKIKR